MTSRKRNARRVPGGFDDATADNAEPTAVAPTAQADAPEHNSDRQRFLTWALMPGVILPIRVVERIVAEIEGDE